MKTFFNWLLKNLSNIFGLIGILLTIYFGAIYAPSWIEEAKNVKIRDAQQDIQQSIKELVYSDSTLNLEEVQSLLTAKEIEIKETFPFTLKDMLILTQESFMEDKFIPLNKRRELNTEIEILKKKLPMVSNDKVQEAKSEGGGLAIVEYLVGSLSVLVSIGGVLSFYIRYKSEKDQQDEINNDIERQIIDVPFNDFAGQIELEFFEAFKKIKGIDVVLSTAQGYDLSFTRNNTQYFVELKFLNKSKVGLGTIKRFLNSIKDKSGEAWFIYNTDVTALVANEVKEFNASNSKIKVKLIRLADPSALESKFTEIVDFK